MEKNSLCNKVTLYHDGECPLCSVEVNTMKKLDIANAIYWVDISKDKIALEKAGISYESAMARIHVRDKNQVILTGVSGFLVVWQHLPYYRRVVPVIRRTPLLLPIMEYFYSWFAKYRLLLTRRNKASL